MKAKQRSWPDRRGMGAQSDFIAEQFVPSEAYQAQQRAMSEHLLAAGVAPTELPDLFLFPTDLLAPEIPEPNKTKAVSKA
jgi:hypothetical protein